MCRKMIIAKRSHDCFLTLPDCVVQEVVNKKAPFKNFKIANRRNRCLHLQVSGFRFRIAVMITSYNQVPSSLKPFPRNNLKQASTIVLS